MDDILVYDNSGKETSLLVTKKGMSNGLALKKSACYRDWFLSQLKTSSCMENKNTVMFKF